MIREVKESDKEAVVGLIKSFFDETLTNIGFKYDDEKVRFDFDNAIKSRFVYGLVIDNDGEIDGFISAILIERIFIKGFVAQELMWYVRPDKRRQGIKLLKEFEKRCKFAGCEEILMIGLADTKAENMYEKFGYRKLETTFIKNIGG